MLGILIRLLTWMKFFTIIKQKGKWTGTWGGSKMREEIIKNIKASWDRQLTVSSIITWISFLRTYQNFRSGFWMILCGNPKFIVGIAIWWLAIFNNLKWEFFHTRSIRTLHLTKSFEVTQVSTPLFSPKLKNSLLLCLNKLEVDPFIA